jgi:hypothetical protein
MLSHDSTRRPDRPWTLPAQSWVPGSAPSPSNCCPPAAAATPAWTVSRGRDRVTVRVLLSVLLCGIAVVAAVQWRDLVLGAGGQRIQVCNRYDYSPDMARCTVSDPFIVVHHGTTSAYLQIALSGHAPRSGVPVTIDVSESNGAGLVTATASSRRMLHPDGAGVAVLPLQGVFAACRIPLPAASAGSPNWERAAYAVVVRDRTTILGEILVHAAL